MKHQVKDWMSKRLIKIDKHESIKTAKEIMHQEVIRHLLVCDAGNLIGVLSEADLQVADSVKSRFKDAEVRGLILSVGDLMSRHPITITGEKSMSDAIQELNNKRIRCLPVMDEKGSLLGVLTESDILRYALIASQQLDFDRPLPGYVYKTY